MATYVISDIHGCIKTFDAMLDRLGPGPKDRIVLLGDYVNRGPDSKGVLDRIRKLNKSDFKLTALRGNHDEMLREAIRLGRKNESVAKRWSLNEGRVTLSSFGVKTVDHLPGKYFKLLDGLDWWAQNGDWFFVHAGFNLSSKKPLEDRLHMLWVRDWYDKDRFRKHFGAKARVVHGHTSRPKDTIKKDRDLGKTVLSIDAGCSFAGIRSGMGYLCAFNPDTGKLTFEPNRDR